MNFQIAFVIYMFGMTGINCLFEICSDSVPLTQNVNGKLSFFPGETVLNGTVVTIKCIGTDGIAPPNIRPDKYNITKIKIFDSIPPRPIHDCIGVFDRARECHYNITATKGSATYHCQFHTDEFKRVCSTSKNLTVSEDVCQVKPAPCHPNATCKRTSNSFRCKCDQYFTGDGKNCTGLPKCVINSNCHIKDDPVNCELSERTMECHCRKNFTGNGTHCEGLLECATNSTCNTKDDPLNCKTSGAKMECHCQKNFIGNGTHCNVNFEGAPDGKHTDSSDIIIVVIVVVLLLTALVIFAIALSIYRKRRIVREEEVHGSNKGRSGSKDNLGILFPEVKKDVESSPRRKLPSIRDHNRMEEDSEEENIMSYICVLDDWEIVKDNLTILDKKLGGGCFGVVKKGIYKQKENDSDVDGQVVAVKMLKDSPSAADRSDLLMELFILKEVNKNPHPNVITLVGAFTSEEPFLVITEFCARGNLRHLLRKSRIPVENDGSGESSEYQNIFSTLCHRKLLQIAVDIANGMQHLASHQFVHRDLSARNVLIGANYEAKVSDFGLARPITGVDQMYVKSNRNLLPVKWMAVESLTQGIFRTSSDVWAYGIVLWEITTLGEEPYPQVNAFDVFTLVTSGQRMEKPPQCSEELYNIMKKCWEHEQQDRPSFQDIHEQLKEMLAENDNAYINVVEVCEGGNNVVTDDRRISVESLTDLRYT